MESKEEFWQLLVRIKGRGFVPGFFFPHGIKRRILATAGAHVGPAGVRVGSTAQEIGE